MSRRVIPARLALVLAVGLTAPVVRGAETLKWALKPGETLRYTLSQSLESKRTGPGQESGNKQEVDHDLTWKVNSVAPDGTIEFALTIDRARTKVTAAGGVLTYDSQDRKTAEAPANQFWVKAYEAVLGKPYIIKLSPRGEIIEAKLPEGASNALAGSPLSDPSVADSGGFFSEAGVKNLLAQILPPLPKDPIDRGATWDSELALPAGPLRLVFRTRYTLVGPGPVAKIEAARDTAVSVSPDFKVTVKTVKQSGTAGFAFNTAAGRLDSSTVKQSAEMTLSDNNIDLSQTTEITLNLKLQK